jgi:methanogenic corrinoid protein MtbC1
MLQGEFMDQSLLSIGDLADLTGLSVDVIRIWEKRYGFPEPVRLPSGHRRFREADVHRLRLMATAMARGHRPAGLVPLSNEALRVLAGPPVHACSLAVEEILEALAAMDAPEVRRRLHAIHLAKGLQVFLCEVVSPLLTEVGIRWAEGRLDIFHEHLLTEVLEDLLRELRQGFRPSPGAARVALATLPGERHRLGLLMAALVYASRGDDVTLLGADQPLANLEAAVRSLRPETLGISVSLLGGGEVTRQLLLDLRERLPATVHLVVGGQGIARVRRIEGITWARGLQF